MKILQIRIYVLIGLFTIVYGRDSIKDELIYASKLFNDILPTLIDEETRCDITYVINDNTFIYNYTLLKVDINEVEEKNRNATKMILWATTQREWKTNIEFEWYRKNNIIVFYKYKDKYGNHFFEFTFNAGKL